MDYNRHALSLSSCAQGVASRLNQAQNLRRHPFSGWCRASLVLAVDASLAHPDSDSASGHDRHEACVEKCTVGLSATSFIHGWIHVSLVNYLLSGILFLFMCSVVAAINPVQSHAGRHRDGKKKPQQFFKQISPSLYLTSFLGLLTNRILFYHRIS